MLHKASKNLVLFFILAFLISCETFNWDAFARSMNNALGIQAEVNLASQLSECVVIAGDGRYLGKIASKFDLESIFNSYGEYGSAYALYSIWNKYGTYGSEYSIYSPFNPYTTSPPKIYKNGAFVGYLSVNKYLANSISPYTLLSYF